MIALSQTDTHTAASASPPLQLGLPNAEVSLQRLALTDNFGQVGKLVQRDLAVVVGIRLPGHSTVQLSRPVGTVRTPALPTSRRNA